MLNFIEKALKRPKMRSFEGARRRREKFWGILRVWEKKLITFPPLVNRRSETRGGKVIINSTDTVTKAQLTETKQACIGHFRKLAPSEFTGVSPAKPVRKF